MLNELLKLQKTVTEVQDMVDAIQWESHASFAPIHTMIDLFHFPDTVYQETFMNACDKGDSELVEMLLQDGTGRVNPSANTNEAIRIASENGHHLVVDRLLQDSRVNPSADANYAIRYASCYGHHLVADRLLQDGRVDPSVDDNYAIRAASAYGHHLVVDRLLQEDITRVDPAALDNYAIRYASASGHLAVVDRLLQDGRVDPSALNNQAIQFASENGHLAVVDRLLQDDRVDPSAEDNYAIRFASARGHLLVVDRLLQDSRVNPSALINYPIRAASHNGHLAVVERLLQDSRVDPSALINYPIRAASHNGHLAVVERLLQDSRVDPSFAHNNQCSDERWQKPQILKTYINYRMPAPPKRRHTRKKRQDSSFYNRVNSAWLRDTVIPPTESRITQTYFIQESINKEIASLLHITERNTKIRPIQELLHSWDTTHGKIPIGITSLTQIMLTMNSSSDIASRIGWMNRYGVTPPLSVYIQGDPRNHKRCCVFIEEGEPGIGSPDYWMTDAEGGDSHFAKTRKAYHTYVTSLADILGIPDILRGYDAEREFASVFPTVVERRTRIHMLNWNELITTYKKIDWVTLLTSWGLPEEALKNLVFNVTSAAFLHHLQNRMESWALEKWQGWFTLIVAQWIAGSSPHGPLRSAWFAYNRRFLQGSIADESRAELRTSIVRSLMPNTIGKLWIARFCDPRLPEKIMKMIQSIRTAAEVAISRTDWLSAPTRKSAVKKLRDMDLQVCWPAQLAPKEIACTLNSRSLIDNLLSLSKLATDENQAMLVRGDCRHPNGSGWGKPVFEANAYYYPDENRFVLPAAILRPPFYDPAKSNAWNYGAIGATIGHELCHAFDADGRLYDENGDKRDWWTEGDAREYKRRATIVTRLFDNATYRGLAVDGELTLMENIADLGGLRFALEGLKARHGNDRPLTRAALCEFFTAFAISWQSKDRIQRAEQLLTVDPHAPPQLRVDLVVRQMDEWYEAFGITAESPEWVNPSKRIRFFG